MGVGAAVPEGIYATAACLGAEALLGRYPGLVPFAHGIGALFLVIVMSALAVFFLGLSGPFIAMVQVAVYAGAIMVLFLFVIMLLGAEQIGARLDRTWQLPLALVMALIVLALGGFMMLNQAPVQVVDLPVDQIVQGSAEAVGAQLYSTYLFPFEAVSIILLVAIVGAVVLARDERKKTA